MRFRTQLFLAQRGAVSLEMLLAIVPLFFTFLGVLQLALFQIGHLVVTHAATRAVRAAVVVLNDAPDRYPGKPARGDLTAGGKTSQGGLSKLMNQLEDKYAEFFSGEKRLGGARMQQIRKAAYHPLAVLAPPLETYLGEASTVSGELGGFQWGRITAGLMGYAPGAASITVHEGDADSPSHFFEPSGDVTVRVSFLMPCGVPLVSAIACSNGHGILGTALGLPLGEKEKEIAEALQLVESPITRDLLFASGGRYTLIQAQATLPNQGARYHEGADQ